jgi:maltose alpha-D-glucosyltransferase / alpha-amylase
MKAKAAPRRQRQPAFVNDPLWYKDAVIYQLHLKSFFDANDDGIGDFPGLIQKLDYIVSLGVNTIWLLPFYPSPRRDDGYDIAEYRGVHPDYGTLADARRFIHEAHARGLRVITELVINHTSDQHPWFQRARRAKPGSAARDFYVWSDTDTKYAGTRIIFCDTEQSNWSWDPVANAFYWHRFYSHQPDLNFDNPQVLRAVLSVMRFWLDLGVDGLRLDAVPYLKEREGTNNENLPETHEVLRSIRAELDRIYPDRLLLAEANQWPEDTQEYFGAGDECHMAFHFPLMPRMYMALAQEDRFPIMDILRQTPDIPANCQWAIFLRNHDELTLEMVTDRERDYLWEKYAANPRARINLGIRRRLAPLVENDRRRIELLNSLLLSMPGTPVLYYGDEISMGDNTYLGDRDGVRTPMQWSPDRNAGFSRADPSTLVLPPIMDTLYGFTAINVEAQSRDDHSLLNWTRRMLSIRNRHKVFGRGSFKMLYPTNRRIFAYLREFTDADGISETIVCVANVSRSAQAVELDLSVHAGAVPVEMLGGASFPPIGQLPYLLTLPPYGFYWFQLADASHMPGWHAPSPVPMPELVTLILRHGVQDVLQPPARSTLERDILPAYLANRRWYAAAGQSPESVTVVRADELPQDGAPVLLTEVEAQTEHGPQRYQLPLGFIREDDVVNPLPQQLALARARRGASVGFLTDAFSLPRLGIALIEALKQRQRLPGEDSEIRFEPSLRIDELVIEGEPDVRWLGAEQSNSSLVVGNAAIIKLYRRMMPGIHPEAEMGRRLTEAGYDHIAPLLGEVTRYCHDGTRQLLALVQCYRHSQGDAWYWTLRKLERALQEETTRALDAPAPELDPVGELQAFATVLGNRLGEMHAVLAGPSDDPAFAPVRADAARCGEWATATRARLDDVFVRIAEHGSWSEPAASAAAEMLLAVRERLGPAVNRLAARGEGSLITRTHGDLHLGQVLVAQNDAYFIDFEGEPSRPLDERRAKTSPLRDVAGMLRSIDYAAAMAARSALAMLPEPARVDSLVDRYRQRATASFLGAYHESAIGIDHQWQGVDAAEALTTLFQIEKAAYEVEYEAAHRPDWVAVPLQGLARLVERILVGEGGSDA